MTRETVVANLNRYIFDKVREYQSHVKTLAPTYYTVNALKEVYKNQVYGAVMFAENLGVDYNTLTDIYDNFSKELDNRIDN